MDGKQQCKIRLHYQAEHSIWSLCEQRFQRYGPDKIVVKKTKTKKKINKKNLFRKTAQYFLDTTYLRSRYNSIMVQDIEKYYIT